LVLSIGPSSTRPERFSPSEVAAFVRGIDPSFDSLASRFLQEVYLLIYLNKIILFILIGNRWKSSSSFNNRYINETHGFKTWSIT
jgi:hypothetical protein